MTTTTNLVRDKDNVFHIEIPEEHITKLGWRHGFILKIDSDGSKVTVEKLSGFMGKQIKLSPKMSEINSEKLP